MRAVLLAMLAMSWMTGCSASVHGQIPPSTFKFTTVIPADGVEESGWKIAQVLVLLARVSSIFPESSTCQVEVGVPEVNHRGPVSVAYAQIQSAKASDSAALATLGERLPTGIICKRFRNHMQEILRRSIPGAKVDQFSRHDLPRTTFPKRR